VLVVVAGVGGLALLLWVILGTPVVGYDTEASLIWGSDLAHGRVPDLRSPFSPTPHPLAYLAAVLASPLGSHAHVAAQAVALGSLALLAWAGYRLGKASFGPLVGIGFAVVLLTRPVLVAETLATFVDIPFLAFVLLAAALEAERPRRGWPVLALLTAAGLLRPEAWLLSIAYALWLVQGRGRRDQARILLLAAAAPIAWAALDLALAGDALYSLHYTSRAAGVLHRPQGPLTAVRLLPNDLAAIIEAPLMWGGLVGFLLCLYLAYERALVPGSVLVLGLASFLVLGILDLPLLRRYVLSAAAMLALFSVAGALGWRLFEPDDPRRRRLLVAALVPAAAIVVSIPGSARHLDGSVAFKEDERRAERSLRELGDRPAVRAASKGCATLIVPDRRVALVLSRHLDRRLSSIRLYSPAAPTGRSLMVAPRSEAVRGYYAQEQGFRFIERPAGSRTIASNMLFEVWADC
jgi:hypothetical protein